MRAESGTPAEKQKTAQICISAAAFCILLLRPLPSSWVIAPIVCAALCLFLVRSPDRAEMNDKAGTRCQTVFLAVLISLVMAVFFTVIWLRTRRIVSLHFLDWRAAAPFLLTAVICTPLAIPFLDTLIRTVGQHSENLQPDRTIPSEGKLTAEDRRLIVCTAIAAVSVCSLCSPLYPFNNWVDANCFFTVGKSILHGIVPYRDIYEQKGPLLYALYALAYPVSHRSFFGVWLLEIISGAFFLALAYRTFFLIAGRKSPPALLLTAAICYTVPAFLKGGSAEEFCLPLIMAGLFYGVRSLKLKRELNNREGLVIGLTAGAVFWIKYSMLGFYIGFVLFLAVQMIRRNGAGRLVKLLGAMLLGACLVSLPVLLYFAWNHALGDLWQTYFYNNIFVYGKSSSFFTTVKGLLSGGASMMTFNDATLLLVLFSILTLLWEKKKASAAFVTLSFGFAFGMIYAGGINLKYYSLILCVFVPVGVAQLWKLADRLKCSLSVKPLMRILSVILFAAALFGTENRGMLTVHRAEMPQFIFAETMQDREDVSLFNYGALDIGLFTTADLFPSTRYFCMLNLPSEEMVTEMERYMADGVTDYIVSRGLEVNSPHYRLIRTAEFPDEGTVYTYYLYERQ